MTSDLEQLLGHCFANQELLERALVHASLARTRLESNERLEFLGDSVLGLVACAILFEDFPEYSEGEMTQVKSEVVSRQTCAVIAKRIGLTEFLKIGKGVETPQGIPDSIIAGAFEAIVGALYLDGGLEVARQFLSEQLKLEIQNAVETSLIRNAKSELQHLVQRDGCDPPTYVLVDEEGPDHKKTFQISAKIGSSTYPPAWGNNKKEAEQRAAWNALQMLGTSGNDEHSTDLSDPPEPLETT